MTLQPFDQGDDVRDHERKRDAGCSQVDIEALHGVGSLRVGRCGEPAVEESEVEAIEEREDCEGEEDEDDAAGFDEGG